MSTYALSAQRVPDDAFIVKNFALTGAQAERLRDKAHAPGRHRPRLCVT